MGVLSAPADPTKSVAQNFGIWDKPAENSVNMTFIKSRMGPFTFHLRHCLHLYKYRINHHPGGKIKYKKC